MKQLLILLLLAGSVKGQNESKLKKQIRYLKEELDRKNGVWYTDIPRKGGYASHAYYFPIAISDSGFFSGYSIPVDGYGIWRPSIFPFVIQTGKYRITLEILPDSLALDKGVLTIGAKYPEFPVYHQPGGTVKNY